MSLVQISNISVQNNPASILSHFEFNITFECLQHLPDTLEWKIYKGKILVKPVQKRFIRHRNRIKTGLGQIEDDIQLARKQRVDKFRV